jgi:hypothetical protein
MSINIRVNQTQIIPRQFPFPHLNIPISLTIYTDHLYPMVLTRSRSQPQQANQDGNVQRNTDKEMKPSPNSNSNGNANGHETRNHHHLHPSLQQPKADVPESTAHHHPSFQPYCKHSEEDGDLHSHALGMFPYSNQFTH